jgi:hypothetical protein
VNGGPAPHRSAGLHDAVLGLPVLPGPALPPLATASPDPALPSPDLLAYSGGDKASAASITRSLIMSGYRAIDRSGLIQAAPDPRRAGPEHAP